LIEGAMQHLPAIGRERLKRLQEAGITTWQELRMQPPSLLGIQPETWNEICCEIQYCEQAVREKDHQYLLQRFYACDHWRILARLFPDLTFFDIETDGLACDSTITVIVCRQQNQFYKFVNGENLNEFLEFLEQVELLVSFNGNSFDVPHIERTFNIPGLPCPHLDLRWVCYHEGLKGGLKKIEQKLGILRPPNLVGVEGADAVRLWQCWQRDNDHRARELLERYCCADVAALELVASAILHRRGCDVNSTSSSRIWEQVDAVETDRMQVQKKQKNSPTSAGYASKDHRRLRNKLLKYRNQSGYR